MKKQTLQEELKWVTQYARLSDLMERYPSIWRKVGPELLNALETGRADTLGNYPLKAKSTENVWLGRIRKSRSNRSVIETALPHLIQSRMELLSVDKCYQAAALGKSSGKIRFNRYNGYIIQRLLFSRGLTRKPVSMKWFGFWWRFTGQKRLLMPLVQPKGIYCFFSGELIRELKFLIGDRTCVEIAAGDGTLTRFLKSEGISMHATDNYSWKHTISFPEEVENLDAKRALDRYRPQAVVCSWPPPGNGFEQKVFSTRSVELYIVIGSRYRFASGNWDSYTAQSGFDFKIDPHLSSLVLPPELESAVVVFRRKPTSSR